MKRMKRTKDQAIAKPPEMAGGEFENLSMPTPPETHEAVIVTWTPDATWEDVARDYMKGRGIAGHSPFHPLPTCAVRDALASTEPDSLLAALSALHGPVSVLEAVEAMTSDPNYGATAAAWLAKP